MLVRGAVLAVVLHMTLSACTQSPVVGQAPAQEFSAQGLHPVTGSGFQAAYIHPQANLATYRALDIVPLDLDNIDIASTPVAGTLRRDWQMTGQRKTALQNAWAVSMSNFFSDYSIAAKGETGLRIAAALTRVAPGRPSATTIGGAVQPVGTSRDAVEVSAEIRLYDKASGALLAVVRDRRTMTSVAMSRTAGISMQSLFNSWAALLHTRISGNQPRA